MDTQPKNMTDKSYSTLVLLAGPPRSGTTWLNREICSGAEAFPFISECTLLTQQVELYSRTLHYCDQQRFNAYFLNKENLLSYYRDNVIRLLDLVAKINNRPGAELLVLKDPELSLYLDELRDLFPPFKLIVLVRDPRDVLASMKNVAARKQVPWDVQDAAARLFSYYYRIGNHQQQADRDAIFVRYEDLVAGGLVEVRAFLQQTVVRSASGESEMKAVGEQLSASDPFFSELYLQPTTQKKVGSYKEILSSEEIAHIEAVYSGVLERWAY